MTSDTARAAGGLTAPETGAPGQAGPPGGSVLDRPEVQGAGWVWGDAGARVPPDAPLPALLSVAVRLLGAFIGSTMQGTGISPADEPVIRKFLADTIDRFGTVIREERGQ